MPFGDKIKIGFCKYVPKDKRNHPLGKPYSGDFSSIEEFVDFLETKPKNQLEKIKKWKIYGKKIKEIPKQISKLTNLKTLGISHTSITELPDIFANFQHLKMLTIFNNKLNHLPYSIGKLKNLESLSISSNFLTRIPSHIIYLPKLKFFDIDCNKISLLPKLPSNMRPDFRYGPISKMPFKSLSGLTAGGFKGFVLSLTRQGSRDPPILLTEKGKKMAENSVKKRYDPNIEYPDLGIIRIWNKPIFKKLKEYYKKHPQDLAKQYINNPDSLTSDEKIRLAHEADFEIRQFLENHIDDPSDEILAQINERFKVKMKNGMSIYL